MNIENEIFKRTKVNLKTLDKYGFKKADNYYVIEKLFLNNKFKAIIKINNQSNVVGKVIDLEFNEEYIGLRTKMNGEFVNLVKESYKNILIDIRNKCFETKYYIFDQSNRINKYIKTKYNTEPEFLWEKTPGCGVYKNKNNKWYGIIMNLDYSKIDNKTGEIEIINVKLDENKIKDLLNKKGFYKAYHMSKKYWITIILNDTLKDEEIFTLIDESYNLVK